MLRIQHTVLIPRTPERVWALFEDLPAWPKWNPVTTQSKWLSEGQWRRGARATITLRLKNKWITHQAEVAEVTPTRSVAWVVHRFGMTGRLRFTFEAEGTSTRATVTEMLAGPLLFLYRLIMPPARIKTMLARWLDALAAESQR